jgi:hypothetical protein
MVVGKNNQTEFVSSVTDTMVGLCDKIKIGDNWVQANVDVVECAYIPKEDLPERNETVYHVDWGNVVVNSVDETDLHNLPISLEDSGWVKPSKFDISVYGNHKVYHIDEGSIGTLYEWSPMLENVSKL